MRLDPIGIVRQGVRVSITLEAYADKDRIVCLIHTLEGRISLPPRKWLRAVRDEVRKLERIAKAAGCVEMRIEGRDWSRILTDYQPWPQGEGHGLRKAL